MTWEGWLLGCDNNQAQTWYDAEDLSKGLEKTPVGVADSAIALPYFQYMHYSVIYEQAQVRPTLESLRPGTTVNVPTVAWVRMLPVHAKQVFWVEVPTSEAFWQMSSSRGPMMAMHISVRRVPHVLGVWKYARVMFLVFSLKSVILSAGAVVTVAIVLFSKA